MEKVIGSDFSMLQSDRYGFGFGWLWMSPCGWRRGSEMDMDFGWLWMRLEFLAIGSEFWMAMDEFIRMERWSVLM